LRGAARGLVLLVGLATLIGLLDRVSWAFELADVFRLQYVVVLVGAALVALVLRLPWLAGVAAAFALVNVAVLGIPLLPTAAAADGTRRDRCGLSLRTSKWETPTSRPLRVSSDRTHPDVFGVTELTPAMARHLAGELPKYHSRILEPRGDAYGIAVFSRVPLRSARVVPSRRTVASDDCRGCGRRGPSGDARRDPRPHAVRGIDPHPALRALAAARPSFGRRVVVCGDFNTPPWSGPLRDFSAMPAPRPLRRARLGGYSWPTWSSLLRVPLDNCFVSSSVVVTPIATGPDIGSDHRPLVVDLGVTKQ
jgi:endonuclease/exonuclease/phosphatase (EEP) superfamily protein YafD